MIELIEIEPNSDRWLDLTNLPNEIWKDIKEFEGLYKISNYGRVKSLKRINLKNAIIKERILRPGKNEQKRYLVILNKNKIKYTKKIHRLVAEHFIPNPENKKEINHINPVTNDLCDNRVCNLEWCTSKENTIWCKKLGRDSKPPIKYGKENNLSHPVYQYKLDGSFVKEWDCINDICRHGKFERHGITNCCKGITKKYHNFIWKYKENVEGGDVNADKIK